MNDDTISRQAAIDVLEERLQANGYSNTALVSELNRSIGYLMRLPSAERRGRWMRLGNTSFYTCSKCGRFVETYNIEEYPYCHCGAKMGGAEE